MEYGHLIHSMKLKSTLVIASAIFLGLSLAVESLSIPLDKLLILYLALGVGCSGTAQALNTVSDSKIDEIEHQERPLPRGLVTSKEVLEHTSLLPLAVLPSLLLSTKIFVLAVTGLVFGILYSLPPLYLGRRWQTSYLLLALGYVAIPMLCGWLAVRELNPFILETTAYFTLTALVLSPLRDCCDIKGDSLYGKESLPVKLGVDGTLRLTLVSAVLLSLLFLYHRPGIASYLLPLMLLSTPIVYYIAKNPAEKRSFTLLEGFSSLVMISFIVWWFI